MIGVSRREHYSGPHNFKVTFWLTDSRRKKTGHAIVGESSSLRRDDARNEAYHAAIREYESRIASLRQTQSLGSQRTSSSSTTSREQENSESSDSDENGLEDFKTSHESESEKMKVRFQIETTPNSRAVRPHNKT